MNMTERRKASPPSQAGTSDGVAGGSKHDGTATELVPEGSRFKQLFGFNLANVSSGRAIVRLLCRPTDPAGLGVTRVVFGVLMMLDIWQERGLSHLVEEYGDVDMCRFPLVDIIQPLPLVWMYVVYLIMFLGELGIMLGLLYRLSCVAFVVCYWYLFLLNKTAWNNHSYLFGLFGVLFLSLDANRYWSLDGLIFKKKRHTHVPLWNYAILRFQLFIVYFIAGLKKLDMDWVSGYSMHYVASHFVFAPFRLVLSEEQVSLYIVHLGGLFIDLFIGFFLFFDKTRPIAFMFGAMFHLMNSQMFSIGMFPWMMLATLPLFCYPDWPRRLIRKCPEFLRYILPAQLPLSSSSHCIYDKKSIKSEDDKCTSCAGDVVAPPSCVGDVVAPPTQPGRLHRLVSLFLVLYVIIQCELPYSHSITKGYNHWTQGLYGYSWDMMVHSWNLQHVKVTYINKDTGEEGYLNPKAWTNGARWSSHPDMTKQYAACVQRRLAQYNITNIELYVDVWRALNDRFQQRKFDPRVNILEAPWHPFEQTAWILPLLVDLSDWRGKLAEIEKDVLKDNDTNNIVFVADFPGLYLENFVHEDLGNTSVSVLKGQVMVELVDQGNTNVSLREGQSLQIPAGEFHNIYTVSGEPSCYMYIFVNTTLVRLKQIVDKYDHIMNGTFKGSDREARSVKNTVEDGPKKHLFSQYMEERDKHAEKANRSVFESVKLFITDKYFMLNRSIKFTIGAVTSLLTDQPFEQFVVDSLKAESAWKGLHQTNEYSY